MSDDPRISNPQIWGPSHWIAIHQWQLEEQAKRTEKAIGIFQRQLEEQAKDMEKAGGKSQDTEKSKT